VPFLGADGVLVIDTRGCVAEGRELQADLRMLTPRRPRWIVNTHWHCDHCFGNAAFDPDVAIFGHASVPAMLTDWGADVRNMLAKRSPVYAAEMADLVIVPPNETFTTENAIDIGDRLVELVHPGRGHTAGDIVVRVSGGRGRLRR
jgi:glyoxylase-like metal-dependent hydrolase (beta-lactamase superfamily II)